MVALRLILALLLMAGAAMGGDLADIGYRVKNICHIKQSGSDQVTDAEIDTLINARLKSFARKAPNCLIKLDTIAITHHVTVYAMNDDVNMIGKAIVWADYAPTATDVEPYTLKPIPKNQVFDIIAGPTGISQPSTRTQPFYVWESAGRLKIHPRPPDVGGTLIYAYHAYQTNMDDTTTLVIDETCWDAMDRWIAIAVMKKKEMPTAAIEAELMELLVDLSK